MMYSRIAFVAMLVASAAAFMTPQFTKNAAVRKSSQLNMAIASPKIPVFLYEFELDVSEADAKATESAVEILTKQLSGTYTSPPAREGMPHVPRVHIAYKDLAKKTVAIDVCSDSFEGKSENARTSMVLDAIGKLPFTVEEIYTTTFAEKFYGYLDFFYEDSITVGLDEPKEMEFKKDEYESRLKTISSEMLKTVSSDIKPNLEELFKK